MPYKDVTIKQGLEMVASWSAEDVFNDPEKANVVNALVEMFEGKILSRKKIPGGNSSMSEQVMGILENVKTDTYEGQKKANFTIDGQLYNVPKNEPELLEGFHNNQYPPGSRAVVTFRVWNNAGKDHYLVESLDITDPPDEGPAPSVTGGNASAGPDAYTVGATCGSILNAEMANKGDITKVDWKAVEETVILALLLRQRVEKRIQDGELVEDVPF